MSSHRRSPSLQDLFREALPRAERAADIRSERVVSVLRDAAVDRDDLRQEVLITVWAALPRFDPGRASLRTFLERIAANRILSFLRRTTAKKRRQPTDYGPIGEPLQLFFSVEFHLDLDSVLGKLGSRERRVAELLLENSPVRVARILGISRSAVYRSIERIRAAMSEAGYGRV
jgi:RNA polymerase sigma-70 factor (ECF subfamily)